MEWTDWRETDSMADNWSRRILVEEDQDGFINWTKGEHTVQVKNPDGKVSTFHVAGDVVEGTPKIEIYLLSAQKWELKQEVQEAIINTVSLSTQPLVIWKDD